MERNKKLLEIFTNYNEEEEVCKQIEEVIGEGNEKLLSVQEVNPLIEICCERKYSQLTKKLLTLVVDKENQKFKNLKENPCALRSFFYSATFGFTQLLSFLLSKNLNVSMKFHDKLTAFDYAIFYSQFESLKLLCENSRKDSPALISAFFLIISLNHTQLILYFLDELKISINCQNKYKFNAFHYAAITNQIDIAKLLIKRGINVYQVTKNNENSLHLSLHHKNFDFANFLMKEEFKFDIQPITLIDLIKPFKFSRSKFLPNNYFTLIKNENNINEDEQFKYLIMLIEKEKIDINIKDKRNKCAINYAISEKKINCTNYLINLMTNNQIMDNNVIREVINNFDDIKQLTPEKWVNLIDNRNKRCAHHSSLQIAILYKKMDIIIYLVEEMKVNINYKDNNHFSALETAIKEKEINIAKYLIEKGISTSDVLYFAAKYTEYYDEFMKYLIDEKGIKLGKSPRIEIISKELLSQKKFQFFRDMIYYNCKDQSEINLNNHYEILFFCGKYGDFDTLLFLIEEMKMNIFPKRTFAILPPTFCSYYSALSETINRGDYEMIEYLIMKERSEFEVQKRVDKTIYLMRTVEYLCESNSELCIKVVNLLLEDNPNLNALDKSDRCVLHYINSNIYLLKLLISKGAKPRGSFGVPYYPFNSLRTPLCYKLLFQTRMGFNTRKEREIDDLYYMLEHIYRCALEETTFEESSAKWWCIRYLHNIGFNLRGNPSKNYAPFSYSIVDIVNGNFQLKKYINLLLLEDINYHLTSFNWKITFFKALFEDPPFQTIGYRQSWL